MPRKEVRQAVTDYLKGAGISYLTDVKRHPPKVTSGGEFYASQDPGHQSGAIIFVHLAQQNERRIALGGPTNGEKMRPYTCGLICVFRSKKPDTQDVGDDNDEFLDSLTAAIEAQRDAGAPQTIFQWGEGDELYGTDVRVRSEMPRPIRQQISQVFSVVEVTVLEILNT